MNPQLQQAIAQAPWQQCECGSILFRSVIAVKRLSALISPDGQEHNISAELVLCEKCGKIPGFSVKDISGIPDELKAVKPA